MSQSRSEEVPAPSLDITYRWADGSAVGDYAWMTTDDQFALDMEDAEEPQQVVIERWERTSVEVRTLWPPLTSCHYEDAEPCDEDSVVWQTEDDGATWMQACEKHRHPLVGPHIGREATDQ